MSVTETYYLTVGDGPEREVSKAEFVSAERAAGFRNTMGQPSEPATAAFGGHGVSGRVKYGVTEDQNPPCVCDKRARVCCPRHNKVKQVIVIRRDLKMRRGKEIAQGAHAAMMWLSFNMQHYGTATSPSNSRILFTPAERAWMTGAFRKITCQVQTEAEIRALKERADAAGIKAFIVTDNGDTEFSGVPTITAIAIGPDWSDRVDKITGNLELY